MKPGPPEEASPQPATEKTVGRGRWITVPPKSPVRVALRSRPKPRGIAGNFPGASRFPRETGGSEDWVAEQPVCLELVSVPESLFCRESAGNPLDNLDRPLGRSVQVLEFAWSFRLVASNSLLPRTGKFAPASSEFGGRIEDGAT